MVLINLNTAHPAKMNDSKEKPIQVRLKINSIATGHNNGLNILELDASGNDLKALMKMTLKPQKVECMIIWIKTFLSSIGNETLHCALNTLCMFLGSGTQTTHNEHTKLAD